MSNKPIIEMPDALPEKESLIDVPKVNVAPELLESVLPTLKFVNGRFETLMVNHLSKEETDFFPDSIKLLLAKDGKLGERWYSQATVKGSLSTLGGFMNKDPKFYESMKELITGSINTVILNTSVDKANEAADMILNTIIDQYVKE